MITATQLRAARALLGLDQRGLAHAAGLSLPTIQRMEGSHGVVRGTVDSLMKLIDSLKAAGVELINEGEVSAAGGRGVRLRDATVTQGRAPARSQPLTSARPVAFMRRRRSLRRSAK